MQAPGKHFYFLASALFQALSFTRKTEMEKGCTSITYLLENPETAA
jgi:hypothetical protein